MDIFSILIGVMVSQMQAYVQTHQNIHIKYVQIFVYQFIPQ